MSSIPPSGPGPGWFPEPPRPTSDNRFPPPPPGLRPSQTMANWALGLSLFGCLPVVACTAIGLAVAVLAMSTRDRNHGRGKAIAALIVSVGTLLLGLTALVLISVSQQVDRDESGQATERGRVGSESLRVGDCYSTAAFDSGDANIDDVTLIPCDDDHRFEVYDAFDLDDGNYPGLAAVERQALHGCSTAFRDFIGEPYSRSDLEIYLLYPNEPGWAGGDREVMCSVGPPSGTVTGSLEGSAGSAGTVGSRPAQPAPGGQTLPVPDEPVLADITRANTKIPT